MICRLLQNTCLVSQYADDSVSSRTPDNNSNEVIGKAKHTLIFSKTYFDINDLKLNLQKNIIHFFLINSRQNIAKIPSDTVIKLEGCFIKPSTAVRDLGAHRCIAMETRWHHLLESNGHFSTLKSYKNKILTETRFTIVQTLSLSIINYYINIWGSTEKKKRLCCKSTNSTK